MSDEDDFLYFEGHDGSASMLPADHLERVEALTAALMAAPDAMTGRLAILEVRGGQDLAQRYSGMVIRQALDAVYSWLRDDASSLEIAFRGPYFLQWIFAARSPLVTDAILDTLDEQFDA